MIYTRIKKLFLLSSALTLLFSAAFAQENSVKLKWYIAPQSGELLCSECETSNVDGADIPFIIKTRQVHTENATIGLTNKIYKPVLNPAIKEQIESYIHAFPQFTQERAVERKNHIQIAKILPFKIENDTLKRLISFDINVFELGNEILPQFASPSSRRWASNSVLSAGEWYKIKVKQTGIHKIDVAFLNGLGIDLSSVDPNTIKIYGNHGYMLPELNSEERKDDLQENAIQITGSNDGKFNSNDLIYFYAEGPDKWSYDSSINSMNFAKNIYTDETYYFITFGGAKGKRISNLQANSQLNETANFANFDDFRMHHEDLHNDIKSGREWFGEKFDSKTEHNFELEFPNLVKSENINLRLQATNRSLYPAALNIKIAGMEYVYSMNAIYSLGTTGFHHSSPIYRDYTLLSSSDNLTLNLKYTKPTSNSVSWLDYFSLHAKRQLLLSDKQEVFFNLRSTSESISKYSIQSINPNIQIWNITDPFNPRIQETTKSGNSITFKTSNNKSFEKYISHASNYFTPEKVGKVENQNLHGLPSLDYIVITHKDFYEAAKELVDYRVSKGLKARAILIDEIYNEYSSGAQDMVAVRDFIKSIYDKGTGPNDLLKDVLLFGDASYDFKNRIPGNTNYVITYESYESDNYLTSYCSNDYFAFLDDTEGLWESSTSHKMDINIGRIPVSNSEEATAMVHKIKHYESTKTFGDWRNRLVYSADDSDLSWDSIHLDDAEDLYEIADNDYKVYNNYKVYLDAYEQKSIGNANRYPDATADFNKYMNQGSLLINYTGHGGEQGLAEERLLDVPTVSAWENIDNMPLFITATCEFSRYDDPSRVSAGELCILNPEGGMIGLLTTVRVVQAGPNKILNNLIWDNNLLEDSLITPTLGDIFTKCKNLGGLYGHRNFTLLGDPALTLNYPKHEVITASINGVQASSFNDSLGALDLVTITGHIENKNGSYLSQFNGTCFPIVFDKEVTQKNRQNDPNAIPQEFKVRNEILFKGTVEVVNGFFKYSFYLPKDINYSFGQSKISYYANNESEDAHGYYNGLTIGGSNPNAEEDTTPPEVQVWMDDYSFKSGGITNNTPLLIAKVFDEHGINTSTSGIGREIVGILDKGTENEQTFILNDYYKAFLNSYKEGEVRFPMKDISTGKHTMHVRYWDTYNNSSIGYTEFIVKEEDELVVENVFNYPNPFYDFTIFNFDHNQAGKDLSVEITIYDTYGKQSYAMSREVLKANSVVNTENWEELKALSNHLSPGMHFYQLVVKTKDGKTAKKYGKIICLN